MSLGGRPDARPAALRRLARAAFAAGLLVTAVLSLLPAGTAPDVGLWDKFQHALTYGVLAALGCVGFAAAGLRMAVALGLLAYGAALEALQALVAGRVASGADWLADGVGVAAGCAALLAAEAAFRRRPTRGRQTGSEREGVERAGDSL